MGVAAVILVGAVHLYPLTVGSALSVWAESFIVAVTGLIAGWPGSAVLLLFLTVVTLATSETFGGAFLAAGRNLAIAGFCVLVIVAGRRIAAALHDRNELRRRIVVTSGVCDVPCRCASGRSTSWTPPNQQVGAQRPVM